MERVILLSFVSVLCFCGCSSTVTGRQLLSEDKMEAITASGEGQREAIPSENGVAQWTSRTAQSIGSAPPSQGKASPPVFTPSPENLYPLFNQANSIYQGLLPR